jgi:hypothetical protein
VFVSDFNNRNKEWRVHTSDNKNIVLEGEEVGWRLFNTLPMIKTVIQGTMIPV